MDKIPNIDEIVSKIMNEPADYSPVGNTIEELNEPSAYSDMQRIIAAAEDEAANNPDPNITSIVYENLSKRDHSECLRLAMHAAKSYEEGARADFEKDDPRCVASTYASQIDPNKLSETEYRDYMDLAVMLDPTTESKTLAEEISRKMASVEAAESMTNAQLKSFAIKNYNEMTKEQFFNIMSNSPNLSEIMSPENIERREKIAQSEVRAMAHQQERITVNFPDVNDYRNGDNAMGTKKTNILSFVKNG